MSKLSEIAQKEILMEFKHNLKDLLTPEDEYTDSILLKWLKVRNFNLKESEKIFRINFYNRITAEVNGLLDSYDMPQVVQKYEFSTSIGFAKDGSIIRYVPGGRYDFYGLIMSMSTFQLCLYFSYVVDLDVKTLKEENLKTGKDIDHITYIIDMEGFSFQNILHQCVIETGLDLTRLYQETYPGKWGNILVVNAPFMTDKLYSIFKPVLSPNLRDSLKIAGKDSSKNLLLKYIDADVLPEFLGGTKVDSTGDPFCKEYISFGGKIPEKFHLNKCRIPLSTNDPGVENIVIGPRSVYNIPFIIKECNTRIRLEACVEGGSVWVVGFYKEFETSTENPELPETNEYINTDDKNCPYKQVSVLIRSQAHCYKEYAHITCKWPGIYILHFSNSGSFFSSRKVVYRFTVLKPMHNSTKSIE